LLGIANAAFLRSEFQGTSFNLPTSPESITATFADDAAVEATDSDPAIASKKLQTDLLSIQNWFKKWRMKANES
jgi:hypothetical protein